MNDQKSERTPGATSPSGITRREFMQRTASVAASALLAPALMGGCSSSSGTGGYDVAIKNATIYDGTTAPPYVTDIGVVGDRIVRVGKVEYAAKKVIDARGSIVTPGFIDVHEHTDYNFIVAGAQRELAYKLLEWSGSYNDIYQGITTVVSGNCGFGWSDMNEYFAFIDKLRLGTNSAYLTPHGVLRLELFGDNQPGALNANQLNQIKSRVAQEMEKGAIGLSSGLGYVPGNLTIPEELVQVAAVAKSYGGIYATHIRSDPDALWGGGNAENLRAVLEAIEVGRRTGVRVQISHIQCNRPATSGDAHDLLTAVESARREGIDVTLDQYPYLAGGQNITVLVPKEYLVITTGIGGRIGFSIREDCKTGTKREEMTAAVEQTFKGLPPDKIHVSYTNPITKQNYVQRPLSEIAAREGRTASEMWAVIACQDVPPATIMETVDEKAMETIMPQPYIFTAGDGGAMPMGSGSLHPRVYGTFPRKIRKYVIEKPLMSLQDAIRSMTSLPAEKFQLAQRGAIAEGNFADIAVIDLATINDRADFDSPEEYAAGVVHLLVNGVFAIEDRVATGDRGGVTLRRT
jgi:N-acyl-D-amino-acid deacylase